MAAEPPTAGLQPGMQGHLDQVEAPAQAATGPAPEPDLKSKKAPTGARARSIKTPLQREALEAAYLINQFPAEEVRRALGDRIQLTENQVQVWFSHKRRKDKKTQQSTGQAASTPPATNAPSSTFLASSPAAPTATLPQAATAPALASTDAATKTAAPPAAAAAAAMPFSRPPGPMPSAQLPSSTSAVPAAAQTAAAAAASIPPAASTVQPGHSAYIQQGSVQVPASLQLPYSHLNGNPIIPSRLAPAEAQQMSYRAPAVEQVVRSHPLLAAQTQPMFRPEPHPASQPDSVSQAARVITTQAPRQFLPHQYPPQSFLAAQQNARLGTGVSMSALQPSLPIQASPARPAMTPMSVQTPSAAAVAAAAASSAPAMSAAWSAAQSSPYVSAQLPASMTGASHTPDAGHFHGTQLQASHEDSDAGTEDMDTAPLRRGSHAEWRDLVEHAKSTLPVAFRSDGPQLAFIFDEPPSPDGADDDDPDGPAKRKRVMVDGYEMEDDGEDGMNFKKARLNLSQIRRPPSAGKGLGGAKEDAERRAYREAEKAQMLAKRVEQTMAKDKERMEREKKRVKEKLEREKKKDEVAQEKAAEKLRQLQIREAKKAAERAEKEKKAEERKRLQDEKRREKELLRALAAQERQATRLRQRDVNTGPKDDLDIEWEQLMEAHHQAGYGSGTEDQPDQRGSNLPERPEFPPPSLNLVPAFATDLPHKQGSDMLTVCAFLHSFSDLLGLPPVTLDNLLSAVVSGEQSRLLANVHIALLRLLQMDLEDAHATGAIQGGGATNFMDRAIVNCAHALEEAWAWGFDIDVWRAHLNAQTWPEVLRQYSIAMGLGQKRPKPRRGPKPKLGTEGEDVVKDDAGRVTLVVPARFGLGTVKGAAYKVLQDVGPEGLSITEIARRIQQQGLRDLTTSKTPEASVAGALSRDIIFARVAPATYSLQAIISRHKSGSDANTVKAEVKAEDDKAADVKTEVKADPEPSRNGEETAVKSEHHDRHGSDSETSSDDDEDEEGKVDVGESWLQHLKSHEYDELSFEQRVNILWTLMNLALDGPTVRAALEGRTEEAQRIRKQMWEEARLEKRRRQQEAAEKAKKSAEEAHRALEAYNASTDSPSRATSTPVHTGETNGSAADAQQSQAERNAGASTSQPAADQPHDHEDEMSSAAATKLRSQQRADTIRHAEEVNAIRGEPLGLDRRHNRYWHFGVPQEPGAAPDPSLGRILVQNHENGTWQLLGQAHQIEHLMSSLERKGAREGVLHNALVRYQSAIQQGMPAYSIHMPPTLEEQSQQERSRLYMEHHDSIWSLSVQALPYLQGSDPVTGLPTHKGEASTLTKLKTDMLRVEAALPLSAMKDANWNSNAWQAQVRGVHSTLQLRQALGELETAVHEGFLWQGVAQPRQPLLVKGAWMPIGQACASVEVQQPTQLAVSDPSVTPAIPASSSDSLAWLPATSAAISLRLFAIDSAIIYRPGDLPGRELIQGYAYVPRSAATPHASAKTAEHTEARASTHAHSAGPSSHASRSKVSSLFPAFSQALLQGPCQNFKLPVADFKQAILDAQNGVAAPSSRPPSFKVRLPIGKGNLAGQAGKPKGRPSASGTKPPGRSRNSLGNGKGRSTASKVSVHRQGHAEDMDLDSMPARSNTATPGPSDDDMQSPSRSAAGSDDEEPEISSEEEQQINSDVELSD